MSIYIDAVMKKDGEADRDLRFYWDGVVRHWTHDEDDSSAMVGQWEVRLSGNRLGLWMQLEFERALFEDAGVYAHLVAAPHYNPNTNGWSLISNGGPLIVAMFAGLATRFDTRA